MNKLSFLCLALLALGGLSVLAHAQSGMSRAQVIADLAVARASGELALLHGEIGIDAAGLGMAAPLRFAPSAAGLAGFPADAAYAAADSNDTADTADTADEADALPRLPAQSAGLLSREAVIAEYRRARASGELQGPWAGNDLDLSVPPIAAPQRRLASGRR